MAKAEDNIQNFNYDEWKNELQAEQISSEDWSCKIALAVEDHVSLTPAMYHFALSSLRGNRREIKVISHHDLRRIVQTNCEKTIGPKETSRFGFALLCNDILQHAGKDFTGEIPVLLLALFIKHEILNLKKRNIRDTVAADEMKLTRDSLYKSYNEPILKTADTRKVPKPPNEPKLGTVLLHRGDDVKKRSYSEDFPNNSPNLYVCIMTFYNPLLLETLYGVGVQVRGIIKFTRPPGPEHIYLSSKKSEADSIDVHLNYFHQNFFPLLGEVQERLDRVWNRFIFEMIYGLKYDMYKDIAIGSYQLCRWPTDNVSFELVYEDLSHTLHDLFNADRLYAMYCDIDLVKWTHNAAEVSIASLTPPDEYAHELDAIPLSLVTVPVVLDAMLNYVSRPRLKSSAYFSMGSRRTHSTGVPTTESVAESLSDSTLSSLEALPLDEAVEFSQVISELNLLYDIEFPGLVDRSCGDSDCDQFTKASFSSKSDAKLIPKSVETDSPTIILNFDNNRRHTLGTSQEFYCLLEAKTFPIFQRLAESILFKHWNNPSSKDQEILKHVNLFSKLLDSKFSFMKAKIMLYNSILTQSHRLHLAEPSIPVMPLVSRYLLSSQEKPVGTSPFSCDLLEEAVRNHLDLTYSKPRIKYTEKLLPRVVVQLLYDSFSQYDSIDLIYLPPLDEMLVKFNKTNMAISSSFSLSSFVNFRDFCMYTISDLSEWCLENLKRILEQDRILFQPPHLAFVLADTKGARLPIQVTEFVHLIEPDLVSSRSLKKVQMGKRKASSIHAITSVKSVVTASIQTSSLLKVDSPIIYDINGEQKLVVISNENRFHLNEGCWISVRIASSLFRFSFLYLIVSFDNHRMTYYSSIMFHDFRFPIQISHASGIEASFFYTETPVTRLEETPDVSVKQEESSTQTLSTVLGWSLSYPNGLMVKSIDAGELKYVKQMFLGLSESSRRPLEELERCILPDGTVIRFLVENKIQILYRNGTIINSELVPKRESTLTNRSSMKRKSSNLSQATHKSEPSQKMSKVTFNSIVSVMKSSKSASMLAPHYFPNVYEIIQGDGQVYSVNNGEELPKEELQSLQVENIDTNSIKVMRIDGTVMEFCEDGSLSVLFPGGTRTTTSIHIWERELYLEDDVIETPPVDSERFTYSELSPCPSFIEEDEILSVCSEEGQERSTIRPVDDEGFLIVEFNGCQIEHPDFATVSYDSSGSHKIGLPNGDEFKVYHSGQIEGFYGKTHWKISDHAVSFENGDGTCKCKSTVRTISPPAKISGDFLCSTVGPRGRHILVKRDGTIIDENRPKFADRVLDPGPTIAVNRDFNGTNLLTEPTLIKILRGSLSNKTSVFQERKEGDCLEYIVLEPVSYVTSPWTMPYAPLPYLTQPSLPSTVGLSIFHPFKIKTSKTIKLKNPAYLRVKYYQSLLDINLSKGWKEYLETVSLEPSALEEKVSLTAIVPYLFERLINFGDSKFALELYNIGSFVIDSFKANYALKEIERVIVDHTHLMARYCLKMDTKIRSYECKVLGFMFDQYPLYFHSSYGTARTIIDQVLNNVFEPSPSQQKKHDGKVRSNEMTETELAAETPNAFQSRDSSNTLQNELVPLRSKDTISKQSTTSKPSTTFTTSTTSNIVSKPEEKKIKRDTLENIMPNDPLLEKPLKSLSTNDLISLESSLKSNPLFTVDGPGGCSIQKIIQSGLQLSDHFYNMKQVLMYYQSFRRGS